jgi:nitrite reductase/ring-hydroxylating ferredoxin subunit
LGEQKVERDPDAPRGVTGKRASRELALSQEQRARIDAGAFVRVDLGAIVVVSDVRVRSLLVGRAGGALRAYSNVCAHQAVPLDVGTDSPMAQDGYHLLCHQHGALYRPTDGRCVSGPCKGDKLASVVVVDHGDTITVEL